jgi:protein-tyrosine-phosphatase
MGHASPGPWIEPCVPIRVNSAGTVALPQKIHPEVRAYLIYRGMDPSQHHECRVSAELLRTSDLVIAMSTDHQAFLLDTFQYRAPGVSADLLYGFGRFKALGRFW